MNMTNKQTNWFACLKLMTTTDNRANNDQLQLYTQTEKCKLPQK